MAQLNPSGTSSTCQRTVSVLQVHARMRPASLFPIIPPQIITIEPLCWRRIPIAQLSPLKAHPLVKPSGSFGDALDSSVKRTVFMLVIMHFHDHSMHKSLFLGVREGILVILLIEAIIAMVWLRVVYALFGSLASLKIILLVAAGILSTFLTIDSFHAMKISLNLVFKISFSFWSIFLKILSLSPISVITQRFIFSEIDIFVLTLVIFFITRTSSPSARSFRHPISLEESLN